MGDSKMKKPPITGCRRCEYLKVEPDRDGRIIPRITNVYPCTAPTPEVEDLGLPESVLNHMKYYPFYKTKMCPDQGAGCVMFKLRA